MTVVDLSPGHEGLYFQCLEDWSDEIREAGDHKAVWYRKCVSAWVCACVRPGMSPDCFAETHIPADSHTRFFRTVRRGRVIEESGRRSAVFGVEEAAAPGFLRKA